MIGILSIDLLYISNKEVNQKTTNAVWGCIIGLSTEYEVIDQ